MDHVFGIELSGRELWRRQNARNLMDCYAAGMEALSEAWQNDGKGRRALETLTRLMVDGMMVVMDSEYEKAFYRQAARICAECAAVEGTKSGLFRVYGAIFQDMAGGGS